MPSTLRSATLVVRVAVGSVDSVTGRHAPVESGDILWVDRTVYRRLERILPSLSRGRLRYRGRTCTVLMRLTPVKARRAPESSRQEWAPIRAGRSSCPLDRRHRNLLRR